VATLLAAVAVALGSVAQAVTGFGFSLVSAPFLIAAYRAPLGVRLNLVLSVAVNSMLLIRERRHADVRAAGLLLAPALAVTLPAAYAVRHVPTGPLTVAAGVVCLAGVAALASGRSFRRLSGGPGAAAAGGLSAAMNVVSGMSGPPVVLFSVNARWTPDRARPTLQLYFLGLNLVALVALGWPGHLPLGLLPGVGAGVLLGAALAGRPPDSVVRTATLVIAAAGSVLAVTRGITG
jgi:uncharacterized membrane protein YfcA